MRLTIFILVLGICLFIGGFVYIPSRIPESYTNTIIINATVSQDYEYAVVHSRAFYVSCTGAFIVLVSFIRIYRSRGIEVAPAPFIKPIKLEVV